MNSRVNKIRKMGGKIGGKRCTVGRSACWSRRHRPQSSSPPPARPPASALDAFHASAVEAEAHVTKIIRFHKQINGNDKIFVYLTADYENKKYSLNQVSLWDHIIPDKDLAKLQLEVKSKYPLIDQGSSLRGKTVQFVLHWHVMPKSSAGAMIRDQMAISEFTMPDSYIS